MAVPELPDDWAGALWVLVTICNRGGSASTGVLRERLGTSSTRTILRGLERRGYARASAPDPHGPLEWQPTHAGRDYVRRHQPPHD